MTQKLLAITLTALLLVSYAISLLNVPPAHAATWLSGWQYRKKINVAGSTLAGTDYQMPLFVRRYSGTDMNNTIYVEQHCKTDFSDLRFTDRDGNLLPYCIASMTADEANLWVRCSTVDLSSNNYFYIYYGNPDATSASDIDATFVFADDFANATLNTDRWSTSGSPTVTVDTSQRRVYLAVTTSQQGKLYSKNNFTLPSYWKLEGFYANQFLA